MGLRGKEMIGKFSWRGGEEHEGGAAAVHCTCSQREYESLFLIDGQRRIVVEDELGVALAHAA